MYCVGLVNQHSFMQNHLIIENSLRQSAFPLVVIPKHIYLEVAIFTEFLPDCTLKREYR